MKPIFLIGYMGCGKSTLGRKLSRRLGLPFYDTDTLVEEHEGASVNDIFRYEGEERFRELERDAIETIVSRGEACIVSTGGGLPVWRDNMERMNQTGHTIYLHRSAEQIAARLTPYGKRKRPRLKDLKDDELIDFMTRNMAEREPFYTLARVTIECDGREDYELIEQIAKTIEA